MVLLPWIINGWDLKLIDVETSVLYRVMEKEVYMEITYDMVEEKG